MPFIAKSAAPTASSPAAAHWTFDQAAADGFTLFTASPSYLLAEGLSDALRRHGRHMHWIRLGPEDRDPGTLLLSILAAVQHWYPGTGLSTLALMRRRPGPVMGWPPLFGRLAAELAEAMARPAALVFEHGHHLGRAQPTLDLLGSAFLSALNPDIACILMSHEELPLSALPANLMRRSASDLRMSPGTIQRLLQQDAPALGREPTLRAAALCRGGIAALAGVWEASALMGVAVVERAVHRARHAQDLLANLASAWLQMIGNDARRAVSLALRLEYSHPTLTGAALGETPLPVGPWFQQLAGGWSRVRTLWRDPLWSVLAPSRLPGSDVLHRAADYLVNRGASERAIPLYLELSDATCASRTLASEADRLVDLGQWDSLGEWLSCLPDRTLDVEPELVYRRAELAAVRGRLREAERGFSTAASMFAARSDPDRACDSMLAQSFLAARRKDLLGAQARAMAASALADTCGLPHQQVWAAWQLGCVAVADEDLDGAVAHLRRASSVASRIGKSAMVDLVLEAERLSTRLMRLRRERRRHWEAWTELQLAEHEVSGLVAGHLGGGLDRAGGLLDDYGWSGTPLAFKVPAPDPPAPPRAASDRGPWRRQRRAPVPAGPRLEVYLLGQFLVRVDDAVVDAWPSRRARELFKFLVTHREPWLTREQTMEAFWPGSPPEAARNSLNVAIHGVRRALRAATDAPVVVLEAGAYRLDAELKLWVDVDEFEQHVEAGHRLEAAGDLTAAVGEYELATALYQGDFLDDDPYEEWPVMTRERLRVTYLDTLDRLSHLYFAQCQYGSCVNLCKVIVQRDPCREDAHRRLMRCFSRQGQTHLALRQYQICADALRAELTVDPDPSTVSLRDQIRSHQAV